MNLPKITLSKEQLADFDDALQKEWLITNGLGGYASSTILGLHTRKYHGTLVAAFKPPGERTVCLSHLQEDIVVGEQTFRLGVNVFHDAIFPKGFEFLKEFSVSPFPEFYYEVDGFSVKKTVFMPKKKNTSIALYTCTNKTEKNGKFHVYPMVTCRGYHDVIRHGKNNLPLKQEHRDRELTISFEKPKGTFIIHSTNGSFVANPFWVENLHYREENARGEADTDDVYQPGYFEVDLKANTEEKFAISATSGEDSTQTAIDFRGGVTTELIEASLQAQLNDRSRFLGAFYKSHPTVPVSDWLNWILLASDSFVVQDIAEARSVIAGYFWFEAWGRDTFISLPGLMLITERVADAQYVLLNFKHHSRNGLIPNIILDSSGQPLYNTVDGTLWYINAILQYLKYTGDFGFVKAHLWETLQSIMTYHQKGTDYDIHLDSDGLISHGSRLTWMDAAIRGEAVTPRIGKAVEIQALWYNALKIMELLAKKYDEAALEEKYALMAEKTSVSFNNKFYDQATNSLYDIIEGPTVDLSLRPNQIIAVSLDYSMLKLERKLGVVNLVQKEFLTPVGLRTLSRSDPKYKGVYTGIMSERDQAYHNGAIWPWLLGPFITAYLKTKGYTLQNITFMQKQVLEPFFEAQIYQGGLGTISEIFDGEPPHLPRGCIAQAWSVAEPLRAYIEDILQVKPRYIKGFLDT
jgi:predicted glycogen debranching enzyme